jgi:hypothetical protein
MHREQSLLAHPSFVASSLPPIHNSLIPQFPTSLIPSLPYSPLRGAALFRPSLNPYPVRPEPVEGLLSTNVERSLVPKRFDWIELRRASCGEVAEDDADRCGECERDQNDSWVEHIRNVESVIRENPGAES